MMINRFQLTIQVFPLMDLLFSNGTGIFQEDSATIYQAQIVNKRFREAETSLSHMDWPPL